MLALLKQRNFFIFWLGELITVIGDHISIIAFPWLVLQMTGSAFMTGLVLAAQGIPRAILMLWGGALVDRNSPRMVMIVTDIVRFILMLALGLLILDGSITLPIIFVGAALFGIADAFFYPATTSILPSLLKKNELLQGNAIVQMTTHTAIIFGPVIAGLLIMGDFAMPETHTGTGSGEANFAADQMGLARAFIVDAATFGFSIFTLLFIKTRSLHNEDDEQEKSSMIDDIKVALKHVWSIPALRLCFIGIAVLEFFFQAPIFVGLPVLMKIRFADGALVYGIILGAYGLGALIGSGISGSIKPFQHENIPRAMFLLFAWSGLTVGLMVIFPAYQVAMILFFFAGLGDNFMWVQFTTWIQQTTPDHLMGRVMSILMFLALGLLPIANMIMGFLFEIALEETLIVASAAMVIICGVTAFHKDIKRVAAPTE